LTSGSTGPGVVVIAFVTVTIHRVWKKKRPEYSRRNFDKFRHSFVVFGTNYSDTSLY